MTVVLLMGIGFLISCASNVRVLAQEPGQQRLPVSALDAESQRCMRCHNGSNGPVIELRPINAAVEFRFSGHVCTVNHSIGMDYRASYLKQPDQYRPVEVLDPAITLVDGRLGCLSCHIKQLQEDEIGFVNDDSPTYELQHVCTVDTVLTLMVFGDLLCIRCHIR